jgi:DNA-binding transcriptional regulator YiaG
LPFVGNICDRRCLMSAISPEQCRAARALLDWTREELSEISGVPVRTLTNFETGATNPRDNTTLQLLKTFQAAGIVFVSVWQAPGGVIRLR